MPFTLKAAKHAWPRTRYAFTLTELLVVIAIITVIAALLLPVFLSMRERARRTACLSNLRQIGLAVASYSQDHSGYFPPDLIGTADAPNGDWATAIYNYAPAEAVYRCPSCVVPSSFDVGPVPGEVGETAKGYTMSDSLFDSDLVNPAINTSQVQFSASTVVIAEFSYTTCTGASASPGCAGGVSALNGPDDDSQLRNGEHFFGQAGALRHQGGSNYLFADGHTQWYRPADVLREDQGNNGMRPSFDL